MLDCSTWQVERPGIRIIASGGDVVSRAHALEWESNGKSKCYSGDDELIQILVSLVDVTIERPLLNMIHRLRNLFNHLLEIRSREPSVALAAISFPLGFASLNT